MADAAETPAATDPLERIWGEVRDLGLESNVADLDAHGYTVIPPELAGPSGLADRLLEAVMDVAERRNDVRPDLETGSTHEGFKGRFGAMFGSGDSPIGDLMQSILFEDRVFEEALMNPVLLALSSYMCGYSVVMSSMGCFMKGPNKSSFALHSDTPLPSPLTPHALPLRASGSGAGLPEGNAAGRLAASRFLGPSDISGRDEPSRRDFTDLARDFRS